MLRNLLASLNDLAVCSYIGMLIFTFASCLSNKDQNSSGKIGLRNVELETLEGEAIDLKSYKGKTVFLNFWATWCKPCIQEMPTIEKAMADLKDENIIFLFASDEEADQIRTFENHRGFGFQYVRVLNIQELNILALPTTFIFNEAGELIFSEMGYRDWSMEENKKLINPSL